MKVILLTDVPKVGKRYDVKEFKDGYAINVLISRGLAEQATPHALAKLEHKKAELSKKRAEEAEAFSKLISSIGNTTVTIKVKANEKGHLFKAVSPRDVANAIKKTSGIEISDDAITTNHIKELGSHRVIIKKGDKRGECTVIVDKE